MRGAYLPGNSTVDLRELPDPEPGHGQVVLRMRASTICGSDLRAIYRKHLGSGPEGYAGVVAGHEPSGEVVAVGPGVRERQVGDRVVVYHISGCGLCDECRRGYRISCTSPARAAYGWQRDGGHAEYLLAEESDLLVLPDALTYEDGACVACGFATAYEALRRVAVDGADQVVVTGLGPVGLATGMLAKALGAVRVVGTDPVASRRDLATSLGAVDVAVDSAAAPDGGLAELLDLTGGGAEVCVDCSGNGAAQATALQAARRWGRVAMVGEGGRVSFDVSEVLIHRQLTVVGSWVASVQRTAELLELLARRDLHPGVVVTERFALADASAAYAAADRGEAGKVGIVTP